MDLFTRTTLTLVPNLNLFQGRLKENIFFLHIPKCGGNSFREAIRYCYANWDFRERHCLILNSNASSKAAAKLSEQDSSCDLIDPFPVLKLRENLLAYYMCHKQIKYIAGHFPFSSKLHDRFQNKYKFIIDN